MRAFGSASCWSETFIALLAGSGRPIVPVLFLAEVAGAVSRQSGRAALGRQASNTILTNADFQLEVIDRSLAEAAARHAADLPLKGADAIYVALAERLGIPLVTWDNEQLIRA